MIVGSGPNRIGQGIEFDYCCVHAAQAFRKLGYEAVLVNSNPETVSTDYDTSDRLYLEPLTLERVLDVCALEQPLGVVVSLGGPDAAQPRARARGRGRAAARRPAARDRRAPRTAGASRELLDELGLRAPALGRRPRRARRRSRSPAEIGYPVLVRPHYVLGGRGMRVVAQRRRSSTSTSRRLVDEFLEGALELDVDALCDGEGAWVAGDPRARRAGGRALRRLAPA